MSPASCSSDNTLKYLGVWDLYTSIVPMAHKLLGSTARPFQLNDVQVGTVTMICVAPWLFF